MTADNFLPIDHIDRALNSLELEFGSIDRERVQQMAAVLRAKKITQREAERAVRTLIEDGCKGKFPRTADILKAARPKGSHTPQEHHSVDPIIGLERERDAEAGWRAKFENDGNLAMARHADTATVRIEEMIDRRLMERGLPPRYAAAKESDPWPPRAVRDWSEGRQQEFE